MNHNLKEVMLSDNYEYSQKDIAEKMFLAVNTIASTEKRAMENFRKELSNRGIKLQDLLED